MGISWNRGYDVVLAVRNAPINRLLAAMHQKQQFAHSRWLNLPFAEVDPGTLPDGILGLQLSPPWISPTGPTEVDRIAVRIGVRAKFVPRQQSAPAPTKVHGDLVVSARVGIAATGGDALISVELDAPDVTVEFSPAPGFQALTTSEASALEAAVRDLLSDGIGPVNHRMTVPTFEGLAVEGLDARTFCDTSMSVGPIQITSPAATALLIDFRQHNPSASELFEVGNPLSRLDDSEPFRDFALSVHSGFLEETLVELARGPVGDIQFGFNLVNPFGTAHYTIKFDPDSLIVELRDDARIKVRVEGTCNTPAWWAFNYDLSITQYLSVSIQNGIVVIARDGNPNVQVSGFLGDSFEGDARAKAKPVLDNLASQASAVLNSILDDVREMVLDSLDIAGAELDLGRVHVDSGALRLLADLELPSLNGPVASWSGKRGHEEVAGTLRTVIDLDAQRSWAPGGTIQSYRWLWSTGVPGEGGDQYVYDEFEHRIVLGEHDPDNPARLDLQVCLVVEGRQPDNTIGGGYRTLHDWHCAWFRYYPSSGGHRDYELESELHGNKGEIVGYAGVPRPHGKPGPAFGKATLVEYRPGRAETLKEIERALDPMGVIGGLGGRLTTLVVLDEDPRALGDVRKQFTRFGWTVDRDGTWAKALRLGRGEATILFDGAGNEVWRHEGAITTDLLVRALEEHLRGIQVTGSWQLAGLNVERGQKAPDFHFGYLGRQVGLRKLAKRGSVLCFFRSHMEPCMRQLERLAESSFHGGPLLLAICDGEGGVRAAKAIERLGLDIQIVTDADRAISSRYGVSIWPTTVHVDTAGAVQHIQMGAFNENLIATQGKDSPGKPQP